MDAFDADVLIYAATEHPLGHPIRGLVHSAVERVGSVLLVPELLSKPIRIGDKHQEEKLLELLSRIDLLPCDQATAELASDLGAHLRLKTPDAIHLATAVHVGADRFITNNRRDFPQSLEEIDVVYPDEL